MPRLFAAIEVPEEVADELLPRMTRLDGARWRPREALHITLRFFGDVNDVTARDLQAELARIPARPFPLSIRQVGGFGAAHQNQTLWAGVADSEPLRALASRCEAAAARAGLPRESRSYRPHVTLAYLRGADPQHTANWLQRHSDLSAGPFQVTWFGLYSSVLHADGSRYNLEREFPLQ